MVGEGDIESFRKGKILQEVFVSHEFGHDGSTLVILILQICTG